MLSSMIGIVQVDFLGIAGMAFFSLQFFAFGFQCFASAPSDDIRAMIAPGLGESGGVILLMKDILHHP